MTERDEIEHELLREPEIVAWLERLPLRMPEVFTTVLETDERED